MIKSPFLIIKDFLSPLECEEMLPIFDVEHDPRSGTKPEKMVLESPLHQQRIWMHLEDCFEDIEEYFNVEIKYVEPVDFELYPENCDDAGQRCENSLYIGGKWSIVNRYDFTVVIFLKDYCEETNLDPDYECYGGQLEMLNHKFKFNPERGTAIIFPSNQYFINRTVPSKFGDVCQARVQITCFDKFEYDTSNFQGDYRVWF